MFKVTVTQVNIYDHLPEHIQDREAALKYVKEECVWDESEGDYTYIVDVEEN